MHFFGNLFSSTEAKAVPMAGPAKRSFRHVAKSKYIMVRVAIPSKFLPHNQAVSSQKIPKNNQKIKLHNVKQGKSIMCVHKIASTALRIVYYTQHI